MKRKTGSADLNTKILFDNTQWAAVTFLAALVFAVLCSRLYQKKFSRSAPQPARIIVEVHGCVRNPGVHVLEGPARTIAAAIEAAGGLKPGKISHLPGSLAGKEIQSGQCLRILFSEPLGYRVKVEPMRAEALLIMGKKLDINKATEQELCLVPHMKKPFAKAIVSRRKQKLWKNLQELQTIPGIGPKTVEKWRKYLMVSS